MTDMAEQEKADLAQLRATTVGELMDMRDALNEAFEAKLGHEPAAGFNVELNNYCPRAIEIRGGYESFEVGSRGAAVWPCVQFYTAQAAFDYAMQEIEALNIPTNAEKIAALRAQIEDLENE